MSAFHLDLKPRMSRHVLFDDVLGVLQIDTSLFPDNLDGFDLVALEQCRFRLGRKYGVRSFT